MAGTFKPVFRSQQGYEYCKEIYTHFNIHNRCGRAGRAAVFARHGGSGADAKSDAGSLRNSEPYAHAKSDAKSDADAYSDTGA